MIEVNVNSLPRLVSAPILCLLFCAFGTAQTESTSGFDATTAESKASQGDVAAMVQLGRAYWAGDGVVSDVDKGRIWLERAAEKDSAEAQMLLGSAYLSGKYLPKNRELAAKYLLQVAQRQQVAEEFRSSRALAQYWVALMYEDGAGLDKSHEKAIQFLQLAAQNGNYPAQYDLASLYNEGKGGLAKDQARACELFEKAADQGHVKAMHNAGYCYQLGTGGVKDEGKAISYYTKAAEAGSTRSEHSLGILYGRSGQLEKAYFWLRIADSSGYAESKPLIEKMKPLLSSAQLQAQEKEVSEWLNAHPAKKQ